jgi:hypothetical protein
MNKENPQDSTNLAGRQYDVTDYVKQDQLSSGLAETHEQVSDAYMEGAIQPTIENVNGKDIEIPREGHKK